MRHLVVATCNATPLLAPTWHCCGIVLDAAVDVRCVYSVRDETKTSGSFHAAEHEVTHERALPCYG